MSSVFDRDDADMPALPALELRTNDTGDLVAAAGQGLTKRQYAAIHLRVPASGDAWLDEMIEQSRWEAAAISAVPGLAVLNANEGSGCPWSDAVEESIAVTNALEHHFAPSRIYQKEPTTNERS